MFEFFCFVLKVFGTCGDGREGLMHREIEEIGCC